MKYDSTLKLYGKEYKFEHLEDEPLTFILTLDEQNYIQRDIDCYDYKERIRFVHKYVSNLNGKKKNDDWVDQIYHGKEIQDIDFMQTLLEHALHGWIEEKPKELPKEEDVINEKNDLEFFDEMLILLARAKGVGIRRKLVYLNRYIETLGKKKI